MRDFTVSTGLARCWKPGPACLRSALILVAALGCSSEGSVALDDAMAVEAQGPFDLDLTVKDYLPSGEPSMTFMFVAVRDADSKELIAFFKEDETLISTVRISKPGVLKKGHRYEVGIMDTWYPSCLEESANVWYREIPAVTAHIQQQIDVRPSVAEDRRGCAVLHEPVTLPPGTYAASVPIGSIAGNRVELVVSP